jgi:hypothetical protein
LNLLHIQLPDFNTDGYLEPGSYLVSLEETLARFGSGSVARERLGKLLRLIIERARNYNTIKRVIVWGSFVSNKLEPRDLDYSLIVDPRHRRITIAAEDRRFFVPVDARIFYGVDKAYLVMEEYPPDILANFLYFIGHDRNRCPRGVLEVICHG